jgi:methyl-accepting chemotaxis protein
MFKLSSIRIGSKLALAMAVPLTVALALATFTIQQKWAERSEMVKLARFGGAVAGISNLVHHMQRERGASAVFVGSKGAQLAAELPQQRKLTDAERQAVQAVTAALRELATEAEFHRALDEAEKAVAQLNEKRKQIDAFSITATSSNEYFTSTIARLLVVATEIGKASTRSDQTTAIASYVAFMQGKERSGQERATGAAGISAGKFEMAGYLRVLGLVAAQETYFAMFIAGASADEREFFARVKTDPIFAKVEEFRKVIGAGGLTGTMTGLDGATWFHATTARIDMLKTVEDRIAGNLRAFIAKIEAGATSALILIASILALVMATCLVVAVMIRRDVSRGINSIIAPMRALSEGDLAAEVPHQGEKTEIGAMADTLQVFKDALIAKKAADEAAAVEAEAKIRRGQRVDAITREFETMVGDMVASLSSASFELEGAANTLTSTAETTQQLSDSATSASREVSDNVQSVAAASEEITSSVNEISRQVQESARVAQSAVQQAEKTDVSIAQLSQAASRIGDVVKLITAVAEQTNLLALNATIEAARAGDAGRGFAVVASEVKALAAQTAKATEEISTQIAGMQSATEISVSAIREIGKTIASISEISSTIASAVEEQGAATKEIARNMQEAARLSTQVASNVTDVNKNAGETGSASTQVLVSAQSLSRESGQLRLEVDKFLTAMRAA